MMCSFAGSRSTRHHWAILLSFCVLVLLTESTPLSSPEPNAEDPAYPSELPCRDNNHFASVHGETYKKAPCAKCTCNNSTLICEFETCLPTTCSEPLKLEGKCCKFCPYNVTVTRVAPILPGSQTIRAGQAVNDLSVSLVVTYANNREATSVYGNGLWQTRMWLSSHADGSTELPGTVVENILSEGQQSQYLRKRGLLFTHFNINDIRYSADMSNLNCNEPKYLCAKFNKGENPEVVKSFLNFYFEAKPNEEVLIGCTPIEDCQANAEDPAYPSELPCRDNNHFASVHGESYKMTPCAECTCDNSTLSCAFESCPPTTCSEPLEVEGKCCKLCPYTNAEDPAYPSELPCRDNNHFASVHGETYKMTPCAECTCDNSTLSCAFESCPPTTCSEPLEVEGECCNLCPYNVTVTRVAPILTGSQTIWAGQAKNDLSVNLNVTLANNREVTGVKGHGLWQTRVWLSSQSDGSTKLPGTVVENVLSEEQRSQDLKKRGLSFTDFNINDIRYSADMSNLNCNEAKYLCAKFNKGENPEVEKSVLNFYFGAKPTEEVLTGCTRIEDCRQDDLDVTIDATATLTSKACAGASVSLTVNMRMSPARDLTTRTKP